MAAQQFKHDPTARPGPSDELFDKLFAPTSGRGWRETGDGTNSKVVDIDPYGLIQKGSKKYGLTAWDDLFDDSGNINDYDALLRSLNFGNVTSKWLKSTQGTHGFSWKPSDWMEQGFDGHSNGPPVGYNYDLSDPLQQWLYNISFHGRDRGRSGWTGREKLDQPAKWFDPSLLRLGMEDIQGLGNMSELDAYLREMYGVDAATYAGSSNRLLDARAEWAANPDLWFDPSNPGALAATGIPGMSQADSAIRMGQYQDWYNQLMAEQAAYGQETYANYLAQAQMEDPYLYRTGLGGRLEQEASRQQASAQILGAGANGPQAGYDFLLQYALMPRMMELATRQAGMGMM